MAEKINPFNDLKKPINWAQKANDKISNSNNLKNNFYIKKNSESENKTKLRVAKSFKVFPGNIIRNYDKRINKLQVFFDDKNYDKNYVDSGKYLMFLMGLAEKFELFELYEEVDENGNLNLDLKKFKEFINKK